MRFTLSMILADWTTDSEIALNIKQNIAALKRDLRSWAKGGHILYSQKLFGHWFGEPEAESA